MPDLDYPAMLQIALEEARQGLAWLRDNGVEIYDLHDPVCIKLPAEYIAAYPEIWNEDMGEGVTPGHGGWTYPAPAHGLTTARLLAPHRDRTGPPLPQCYGPLVSALLLGAGCAIHG
jgi:hypothetical protein